MKTFRFLSEGGPERIFEPTTMPPAGLVAWRLEAPVDWLTHKAHRRSLPTPAWNLYT